MYCQSDREAFFSGEHIYSRGYFDYERDGFGEVTLSLEDTVDQIISYMENGCTLKDVYKQRIEAFYAYHDKRGETMALEPDLVGSCHSFGSPTEYQALYHSGADR